MARNEEYVADKVLVLAPVEMWFIPESRDPWLCGCDVVDTKAVFIYDPFDPLAVQLDIREPGKKIVTWFFARDLLDRGLRRGTGKGDVYIGRMSGRLRIVLRSDEQTSVVGFCQLLPVREFLERTYAVVPAEDEMITSDQSFEDELLQMLWKEESGGTPE